MAEIRFNYGDKFTQTSDSNTGIGSTIPAAKLDIAGGTSAGSLRVTGIATLSSVSGFVNTKLTTSTQNMIVEAGNSGSVSGEVVVSTGQTISVSTGATTGQGGIQSLKVYETFMPPVGGTADRPTDVKPGMVYYNKDFKTIEFWDGNFWKQVDNTTRMGRGFFIGGGHPSTPTGTDENQFINIATQGNALNFGDLAQGGVRMGGGCSSSTRGILGGGYKPAASPTAVVDIIEYFTMASSGDTIDFGNLSDARGEVDACSSSTRGMWAGGEDVPFADMNIIDYIEIATLGNALDFGDLSVTVRDGTCVSSPTRGFLMGGNDADLPSPSISDSIDVWIIASKGNSKNFGNLAAKTSGANGGCSSSTRGFIMGGSSSPNKINYIQALTMASEGNAVVFGDLTVDGVTNSAGTSNSIRGVRAGGATPTLLNTIDFFIMASAGNAQDFGDLSSVRNNQSACSDSHGGLGGF